MGDALFSKVQQRVLGVLFAAPERSFYVNEIIVLAHSGAGAVQRELARLEASGLVTGTRIGRQKHYQANAESPLFQELRSLAVKTFGVADVLREALQPLAGRIVAAFIFGSVAKRNDTASSDIDVLVISDDLTYGELYSALYPTSARLGREVTPTVYGRDDLRRAVRAREAFITRVLQQPKVWLIGDDRTIAA